MGWRGFQGQWKFLVLALAALLAAATVCAYFVAGNLSRDEPRARTHDLGVLPSRAWTLDVAAIAGNSAGVLLTLPQTLDSYYGYGAVLDAPTMLVGAIGTPTAKDASGSQRVDAVTLVGISRDDGTAQWRRPIGAVTQCADQLDSGIIACWDSKRIVFVDTATGKLLSENEPDFTVGQGQVIAGTAFVSGVQTNGSRHKLELTSGTPTDPSASYHRSFDIAGPLTAVDEIVPSQNTLVLTTQTGENPIYQSTVYHLDSGTPRFTIGSNTLRVVGDGLFLATQPSDLNPLGIQQLISRAGSPILTAPVPAYTHETLPTATIGPPPVLLGDGAYDPSSGLQLWRDPRMLTYGSDWVSTARALAGATVIVASADTQSLIGLDQQSGQQLWRTPWTDAYWIHGGITDGEYYAFTDYTGLHSLRVADGAIVWSLPLPSGADPRSATISDAGGDILLTTGAEISLWRQDN
ncbi:PQQ-binding-like beta-propeller repeat protein [Williamsia sp. DF01-3]|uniref:outer membrane protein assembly factor BamB family protein n=1 Tax=Williamsia sp. DF01-3 TaxID=2934157 RepID=UPI001FF5D9C4|nr:PQQ-binding-like beta-propeller repeat protein [Williamsia sp. DF01-3]MCK0516468.1 PQQ-like beta-propeller repeat protein [Williamsia sp. DF01-3]